MDMAPATSIQSNNNHNGLTQYGHNNGESVNIYHQNKVNSMNQSQSQQSQTYVSYYI